MSEIHCAIMKSSREWCLKQDIKNLLAENARLHGIIERIEVLIKDYNDDPTTIPEGKIREIENIFNTR